MEETYSDESPAADNLSHEAAAIAQQGASTAERQIPDYIVGELVSRIIGAVSPLGGNIVVVLRIGTKGVCLRHGGNRPAPCILHIVQNPVTHTLFERYLERIVLRLRIPPDNCVDSVSRDLA